MDNVFIHLTYQTIQIVSAAWSINLLHVCFLSQNQQVKDVKRQRKHKPLELRDGDRDERSVERKRQREDTSPHRIKDKSRVQETKEDDTQSSKNPKKKKKKDKKMKKKDKKKEKKKKDKADKK